MLRSAVLILSVAAVTTGCARLSDSRLNPLNWFANSSDETAVAPEDIRPLVPSNRHVLVGDARPMIQTVTSLSIERVPAGALVRATGVAATQGSFNAQLVEAGRANGVLTLNFRVEVPQGFEAIGSQPSREVTVVKQLTTQDLTGIRSIRVQAASNSRVSRR